MVLKKKLTRTTAVLEFKKGKKDLSSLTERANYAIDQIIKKKYAEPYIKEGYRNVYGIGIGFPVFGLISSKDKGYRINIEGWKEQLQNKNLIDIEKIDDLKKLDNIVITDLKMRFED